MLGHIHFQNNRGLLPHFDYEQLPYSSFVYLISLWRDYNHLVVYLLDKYIFVFQGRYVSGNYSGCFRDILNVSICTDASDNALLAPNNC